MKAEFVLSYKDLHDKGKEEVIIRFTNGCVIASSFKELEDVLKLIARGVRERGKEAECKYKYGESLLNTLRRRLQPKLNN